MSRILLLALLFFVTNALPAEGKRPNLLFLSVDDLNDWIGCLGGHPDAKTPNMDRLAKRGVLFANAHCAAPACQPSRAALWTGRMPDQTGVWMNGSPRLSKAHPKMELLPQLLAESGYRTLGTGKLHHNGGGEREGWGEYYKTEQRWSPFDRGEVDYSKKELPSKSTDQPRHDAESEAGRKVVLPMNRMPSDRSPLERKGESFDWGFVKGEPDSSYGDTRITDWAIKHLEAGFEEPTFLAVGYYRPHIPLFAPERFFEHFEDKPARLPEIQEGDLDDLSPVAREWARKAVTAGRHKTTLEREQWRPAVEAYLACVSYVDYEIGRLLDVLDASPMKENTMIVLWSDHGWQLGEKEHWGKWTGWERSTRVPLMVVPAGKFEKAGSVCEEPVGLIDLFPTIAEYTGLTKPEGLDGLSLAPLLAAPETETGRILPTCFAPGNTSLRDRRWRYLRYADGSEELYDLEKDPKEWNNLSKLPQHQPIMDRMRRELSPEGLYRDTREEEVVQGVVGK